MSTGNQGILLESLTGHPEILEHWLAKPDARLTGLHCDSRQCGPGRGFFALRGLRHDGHAFAADAVGQGAPVVFVSSREVFAQLRDGAHAGLAGVFLVAPGRAPLARLAADVAGHPAGRMQLLGVTGTNGKTTVSYLVAQLSRALGRECGVIGTLGMRYGTPGKGRVVANPRTTPEAPDIQDFLAECLAHEVTRVVMEVSSIGIDLERSHGLPFAAAAFTNLTQDHLDHHGTLEAYRAAKERLFLEYALGHAVLNVEDPVGEALALSLAERRPDVPRIGYARRAEAALTWRGGGHTNGGEGEAFVWEGRAYPVRLGLMGGFNRANMLAALGLLLSQGEDPAALADAVAGCQGPPGRFERVPLHRAFDVLVDYAHTPDALENLLHSARPLTKGRLMVLFGAGGDRDRAKRPLMGAIADRHADYVVLTSDNPRGEEPGAILSDIQQGMRGRANLRVIPDRREAIHYLLDQGRPGDVLLIAGKGDETYQEIAGRRFPFDDREVAGEWAAENPE